MTSLAATRAYVAAPSCQFCPRGGVDSQEVSGLVKQFLQMRPMMKQMAGMGMGQRMKMAQGLAQGGMLDGNMPRMKKGSTKYNPRKPDRKRKRRRR